MAILVAYDGSRPAKRAVEHAVTEYGSEEIVLLRVIEAADSATEAGFNLLRERLKDRQTESAAEIAEEVGDLLEPTHHEFRIETVVGQPSRAIVRFAEENDIDHIIVGNHGRNGVSRVLLGSVAETVARRAAVPVTIIR